MMRINTIISGIKQDIDQKSRQLGFPLHELKQLVIIECCRRDFRTGSLRFKSISSQLSGGQKQRVCLTVKSTLLFQQKKLIF